MSDSRNWSVFPPLLTPARRQKNAREFCLRSAVKILFPPGMLIVIEKAVGFPTKDAAAISNY